MTRFIFRLKSFRFYFKRFVRKHQRWLTFSGAFIVFMTFIVKEGLAEHWRHIAEAVDTAQYMFAINASLSDNQSLELASYGKLSRIQHLVKYPNSKENPQRNAFVDWATKSDIKASLLNIKILVDKLPNDENQHKEFLRLSEALSKADIEFSLAFVAELLRPDNATARREGWPCPFCPPYSASLDASISDLEVRLAERFS